MWVSVCVWEGGERVSEKRIERAANRQTDKDIRRQIDGEQRERKTDRQKAIFLVHSSKGTKRQI